jgi:hypothetical protein
MKTEIKLESYRDNPRTISKEAFQMLGYAMEEFGDISGIVLNEQDGCLISGHQRVDSLKERYESYHVNITEELEDGEKRGWVEPEHIAFRLVNWDENKARAARLADNKHGGEWEELLLDIELTRLKAADFDLSLTGFLEKKTDFDFTGFEREDEEMGDIEDVNINIAIPAKYVDQVKKWLANGEPGTAPGLGRGVLKRCELL